jgi:hypothetical protein
MDALDRLKSRATLTEAQVLTIFRMKETAISTSCLAKHFGVHVKTVRDIWSGRTWSRETWHLDPERIVRPKNVGRPKGRKDSRPRKRQSKIRGSVSNMTDLYSDIRSTALEIGMHRYSTQQFQQQPYNARPVLQYHTNQHTTRAVFQANVSIDSSQPSYSGGNRAPSIDDQIHDWSYKLWIFSKPSDVDPFLQDWTPIVCDVVDPEVKACLRHSD